MRFTSSQVVLALSIARFTSVLAFEDLENSDVPSACSTICKPIVDLSRECDHGNDSDKAEMDCFCTNKSFDVGTIAPLCASCISQNGRNTDDMDEIVASCSFSSTSYSPSATSLVGAVQTGSSSTTSESASQSTGSTQSSAGGSTQSSAGGSETPTTVGVPSQPTESAPSIAIRGSRVDAFGLVVAASVLVFSWGLF